ncbi:hypothetical protein D9M71_692570 [compost metagenome]
MATWIEDRIKVPGLHRTQHDGRSQCGLRRRVLAKAFGGLGLRVRLVALGVKRWLAALGRGQGQLCAGILEGVIGCSEFFQPEAGFLAGVTQLIVGR